MKKVLLCLVIFLLMLCSCEKKEYHLIELNANELLEQLFKEDCDIVVAYYDSKDENSEQFISDLEKVVKASKENIYYIDVNHISGYSLILLYEYFSVDVSGLRYFVVQDGQTLIKEKYTDYLTLFKNLNGKKYDTEINYVSDEDIDKYLNEANKSYKDGYISNSLDYINLIWNSNKAKEFYDNHELFDIIQMWENYDIKDNGSDMVYTSLMFYSFTNSFDYYVGNSKVNEFTKPEMDEYKSYYYKIINNELLVSEDEDGDYKKLYDIDDFANDYLVLKDKNGKKHFDIME